MKKRHKINSELGWDLVIIFVLVSIMAVCTVLMPGCKQVPGQPPKPPECRVEVLAFTASWCGPCKQARPMLIAIRASGVHVTIIDIDQRPVLAELYGVTSVPTFFVYIGDELTKTHDLAVVVRIVKENIK